MFKCEHNFKRYMDTHCLRSSQIKQTVKNNNNDTIIILPLIIITN